MRDNIIIRFFKEILEKYKKVNKGFYIEVNKIKKIYAGI